MGDGTLDHLFNALEGRELPGGCNDCNAVQTMSEDKAHPGVWHLMVHHDTTCPNLRAMKARSN